MQSSSKLEWLLQAYELLLLGGKEWAGLFFPPHPLSFNCKISYGQVSLKYVFKLYQLFPLINYDLKKKHMGGKN